MALACLAFSWAAQAQVEWFQGANSSHLGARAQANGRETHLPCTFDVVNPPNPLTAWFKQFSHCKSSGLRNKMPAGFIADHDDGYARFVHPTTGQESKVMSIARQTALFEPRSMEMQATVATRYSGQIQVGNRAVPDAWGDVLFTVPANRQTTMVFDGTMGWSGRASSWSGTLQVYSVPNKISPLGARVVNFGYHPSYVRPGASSWTTSHVVTLDPGVYRLKWSLGHSSFDASDQDGEVKLNMRMNFTDDIACKDAFGPAVQRWPADGGYSSTILLAETDEYRDAPQCTEKGPKACWKQRKVFFKIQKGDRVTGPYFGWAYVPGTLRHEKNYQLECGEIDPRYNCHGYMFAGSMLWIEEHAVNAIIDDGWCEKVDRRRGDWSAGDVRVWRDLRAGQRYNIDWWYREPEHSQIMTAQRDVLDEKLGTMAYARPDRYKNLTWTDDESDDRESNKPVAPASELEGDIDHYRCKF